MTTAESDPVGKCPECGASITRTFVLIEYERVDGSVGRFAECPECNAIVRPE